MSQTPNAKTRAAAQQFICQNRRATHDFAIDTKLEAGLVLTGTEVKSCRASKAHLNEAYVQIVGSEAMLLGAHIAEYTQGNRFNHEPARPRKLLLHRHELDRLAVRLRAKGFTAVPLSLYFKNGRVKMEIGIGKGKSSIDRRQDIKTRDAKRELQRSMRDAVKR